VKGSSDHKIQRVDVSCRFYVPCSYNSNFHGSTAAGILHYTVGYVPSNSALDGKYHKLQVKIDGQHAQLDYRRGYFAEATGAAVSHTAASNAPIDAALVHGAPPSSQIVFGVRVLDAADLALKNVSFPSAPAGQLAAKLKPPLRRVVADLVLDPRTFFFDQEASGRRTDHVRFAVMAYNAAGERENYVDRMYTLRIDPVRYDQFLKFGMSVRFPLGLTAGKHTVRVVIEEEKSARFGSFELTVPAASR
jgi:hypothetical protein